MSIVSSGKRSRRTTTSGTTIRGVVWLVVVALLGVVTICYLTTGMEEWNNYRNYQDFFQTPPHEETGSLSSTTASSSSALFQLATEQSYGFFRENMISNTAWQHVQYRALTAPQYKFPEFPERAFGVPVRWLIKNLQPVLTCPLAERLGGAVDVGAFWTCDPYRFGELREDESYSLQDDHTSSYNHTNTTATTSVPSIRHTNLTSNTTAEASAVHDASDQDGGPCLVYCFGHSGAWEQEFMQRYATVCEIHVMDPSLAYDVPSSMFFSMSDGNVHFHTWGLEDAGARRGMPENIDPTDDTREISGTTHASYSQPRSLLELRARLGHADRPIDIVKVDSLFAWTTYSQWIALNATQILWHIRGGLPNPKQAHPVLHPEGPFRFSKVFRTLQDYGYIMFAKDHRLLGPRVALGYLRLHPDFWKQAEHYAVTAAASGS